MDHDTIPGQIGLDIDELIREAQRDAAPAWTGAPLHYTADYWTPDEHAAALARWQLENGRHGSIPHSHIWHQAITHHPITIDGHPMTVLSADTRPESQHHGPGALLYQANCTRCRWHHIADTENSAVEHLHDHAMPRWRDLPVMPLRLSHRLGRGDAKAERAARAWVVEHYPAEHQHPGAPIRTERQRHGTRHVPGRSPFGGFDLTAKILD